VWPRERETGKLWFHSEQPENLPGIKQTGN